MIGDSDNRYYADEMADRASPLEAMPYFTQEVLPLLERAALREKVASTDA